MNNGNKQKKNACYTVLTYLRDYRFNSMFIRFLVVSVLLIAIPVTGLDLFFGNRITSSMKNEVCSINETALDRSINMMDTCIMSLRNLTYTLATQKEAVRLSTVSSPEEIQSSEDFQKIVETQQLIMKTYSYLDSVYYYFEKSGSLIHDTLISPQKSFQDSSWMEEYKQLSVKNYVLQSRCKTDTWPYLITLMFPIRNVSGTVNGAVVMNIDVRQLGRSLGTGSYSRDDAPMLLMFDNESGELLYSDESRLLHDNKDDLNALTPFLNGREDAASDFVNLWGRQYVASRAVTEDKTILYCYLSPLTSFSSRQTYTNAFLRSSLILSILLALLIAGLLSIWAYQPIKNLLAIAEQTPDGLISRKDERTNEVTQIKKYMLNTQTQNANLKNEITERVLSLHNAQVSALQSQINPHFLYNTLEAIGDTMVKLVGHENEASNMTRILAQLLRNSLSAESFLVPLREEIEHVQLYMQLINFRYPEIVLSIHVPPELLDFPVVKLSLQPLIENAIEHGLRPRRCRGKIEITAEQKPDGVCIQICDDGVGMDHDQIAEENQRFSEMRFQELQHIGLQNVNQRVRLIYGEASGMHIVDSGGTGTVIQIFYEKKLVDPPV